MQLTQKQKSKLARQHGGFNTEWWEARKFKIKRKVHDIQTMAHIKAQMKRGEPLTLLNGDPIPSAIPKRKPKNEAKLKEK